MIFQITLIDVLSMKLLLLLTLRKIIQVIIWWRPEKHICYCCFNRKRNCLQKMGSLWNWTKLL